MPNSDGLSDKNDSSNTEGNGRASFETPTRSGRISSPCNPGARRGRFPDSDKTRAGERSPPASLRFDRMCIPARRIPASILAKRGNPAHRNSSYFRKAKKSSNPVPFLCSTKRSDDPSSFFRRGDRYAEERRKRRLFHRRGHTDSNPPALSALRSRS